MKKFLWIMTLFSYSMVIAQNLTEPQMNSTARPTVWWRWMGTQVSKEGITADLEAMKAVGLGGVVHFQCADGINVSELMNDPKTIRPKIEPLSSEWWSLIQHSIDECDRLGLSFRMQNCLGYSTNGGPWIKPEQAMQKLVWNDTTIVVESVHSVQIPLKLPLVHKPSNYYKDIAVLAVKMNDSNIIPMSDIHDISTFMDKNGLLKWEAEKGVWRIIRYGYTPTGVMPHPVEPKYNGLECDKMDRNALITHYTHYVNKILDEAGDKVGRTIEAVLLDSYEAGAQTWTKDFREKFIAKRGYDPVPWFPIFGNGEIRKSGNSSLGWIPAIGDIVIESLDISNRFLYDMQQTIEDLVIEENVAAITEIIHKYPGVKFELQPYNAPYNFIRGGRYADRVSGEFWHAHKTYGWWTLKLAASVAHITGNPITIAESFTALPTQGKWDIMPKDMKAEADLAFSLGVNAFQLHVMPHQPWSDDIRPGMVSQLWGTQINRHNTWWKESKAWNDYLTRTQEILQQGRFVADAVYLYPSFQKGIPQLDGYNIDAIDEEFVISSMNVENNWLVLPGGMKYRILILPESNTMTPALMMKIENLVREGACVLGNRPYTSPSLTNYPNCDNIIRELADKLWGDNEDVNKRSYGKGIVYSDMSVKEVLNDLQIGKDVDVINHKKDIVWTHRRTDDADIYFVANQKSSYLDAELSFRLMGYEPELWDTEKNVQMKCNQWTMKNGRTHLSLSLEPLQSLFVVFRKPTKIRTNYVDRVVDIEKIKVNPEWNVRFIPITGEAPFSTNLKELADWITSDDDRIKYFSGTAVYSQTIKLTKKALRYAESVNLNLGKVDGIANVKVNGQWVRTLWKEPYVVDVTPYICSGNNLIELEITNSWANALIEDEQKQVDANFSLGETSNGVFRGSKLLSYPQWFNRGEVRPSGRKTFTTYSYYNKNSELIPSGLKGDVVIEIENKKK